MSPMKLPYDLVVVDLETNGKDAPDSRIVEFGAAILRTDGTIGDRISQVVDGRPMGDRPSSFTDAMLDGKPLFGEFAHKFPRWCWHRSKNFILSSWNASVDAPLLASEYHRAGAKFPFPRKAFCAKSVTLSYLWRSNIFVASCGIDKALRMLALGLEGQLHRAGDDAYNVARVLQKVFGFAQERKETA